MIRPWLRLCGPTGPVMARVDQLWSTTTGPGRTSLSVTCLKLPTYYQNTHPPPYPWPNTHLPPYSWSNMAHTVTNESGVIAKVLEKLFMNGMSVWD